VSECLHQFSPRPGDCIFLPAGTVHAVGGGVLMAEVQQTSDATFRLFDWNRRDAHGRMRQLHIEEALACINWNSGPVHPIRAENYPAANHSLWKCYSKTLRQELVQSPFFTLEYLQSGEPFGFGAGILRVLLVLHGRGWLESGKDRWSLTPGDSLLLPAALDTLTCHPQGHLGLLLSTLPQS